MRVCTHYTVLERGVGVIGWVAACGAAVRRAPGRTVVYHLKVEGFHSCFVGEGGVWGHNTCAAPPLARGSASEALVLTGMEFPEDAAKVYGADGASIPDSGTATRKVEVKDSIRVTDMTQLRTQKEAAAAQGQEHVLVTGTNLRSPPPRQRAQP